MWGYDADFEKKAKEFFEKACPKCKGFGGIPTGEGGKSMTCPKCKGTGKKSEH